MTSVGSTTQVSTQNEVTVEVKAAEMSALEAKCDSVTKLVFEDASGISVESLMEWIAKCQKLKVLEIYNAPRMLRGDHLIQILNGLPSLDEAFFTSYEAFFGCMFFEKSQELQQVPKMLTIRGVTAKVADIRTFSQHVKGKMESLYLLELPQSERESLSTDPASIDVFWI